MTKKTNKKKGIVKERNKDRKIKNSKFNDLLSSYLFNLHILSILHYINKNIKIEELSIYASIKLEYLIYKRLIMGCCLRGCYWGFLGIQYWHQLGKG